MSPVTNHMLNARRERDCTHVTTERKYYEVDGSFVKRSLSPSEWQHSHLGGSLCIPRFGNERILNEAAALRFIAAETNIPVPKLYACFEDNEVVYLIREYVDGVTLASLTPEQRKAIEGELEGYVQVLRGLTSKHWGGPSGIVVPPYRVMVKSGRPDWKMNVRESDDLVFCHNDFSAHNVIVDPATLKVKAIIDWEYAGFFPAEFEGMFFRRPGPSVALEGELDDVEQLLETMYANEEHRM